MQVLMQWSPDPAIVKKTKAWCAMLLMSKNEVPADTPTDLQNIPWQWTKRWKAHASHVVNLDIPNKIENHNLHRRSIREFKRHLLILLNQDAMMDPLQRHTFMCLDTNSSIKQRVDRAMRAGPLQSKENTGRRFNRYAFLMTDASGYPYLIVLSPLREEASKTDTQITDQIFLFSDGNHMEIETQNTIKSFVSVWPFPIDKNAIVHTPSSLGMPPPEDTFQQLSTAAADSPASAAAAAFLQPYDGWLSFLLCLMLAVVNPDPAIDGKLRANVLLFPPEAMIRAFTFVLVMSYLFYRDVVYPLFNAETYDLTHKDGGENHRSIQYVNHQVMTFTGFPNQPTRVDYYSYVMMQHTWRLASLEPAPYLHARNGYIVIASVNQYLRSMRPVSMANV